jgi:lipid II:glycine glycyltransferase (peptidoglycan interpeptide bridge formation enzyme)
MYFRLIKETDAGRFDHFLESTTNGHIFQSYWWGEVKKTEWEPIRVAGEDEAGEIVAAATILKRKIPFLGKSFFYLPRGPVLKDWHNQTHFLLFVSYLKKLAWEHRAFFIKIDPCILEGQEPAASFFDAAGFIPAGSEHEFGGLQPRYTFRLNIEPDLDLILNNFHHKLRYKINYAYKQGLRFERPGVEGIDGFMEILVETSRRGNFVIRPKSYYQKVYQLLAPRNAAAITLGYLDGKVTTAAITLAFGDKSWNMYSGQSNVSRNIYAFQALIWEQIKWAKERGARWFDFYGVPGHIGEDHPLYGIYHFKKSFGGDFYAFVGEKDLVLSSFYYFFWTRLFPAYRRALLRLTKLFRGGVRATAFKNRGAAR